MAKKIYTLEIDEKNLGTTVGSKTTVQKNNVQTEVETLGVVEINNASASKKLKNNASKGFEKVVSGTTRRTVKAEISHVEDYFDFSFRPMADTKTEAEKEIDNDVYEFIKDVLGFAGQDVGTVEDIVEEYVSKTVEEPKAKKEKVAKKTTTRAKKKVDSKTATILKVEAEHIEEIRNCQVQAEVCAYDDDARYNIDIARLGSLFDCEKTMLN